MLNNKGWGLGAFLGFSLVFIFFIILASVNAYKIGLNKEKPNLQFENIQNSHLNLENTLLDAGRRYFDKNKKELLVTSETLIKESYINSFTDYNYTKCSGYVMNNNGELKSYIKCGNNYKTTGYEEEFDN